MNVTHSMNSGDNLRDGSGSEFQAFLRASNQRAKALIYQRTGLALA